MSYLTRGPRRGIGSKANTAGRRRDERNITSTVTEVAVMTGVSMPSRRRFMVGAAGFSFGVVVGVPPILKLAAGEARAAAAKQIVMSPWVTLSTDGTVAIMSPAAEMGQGSLTSLPLILADEMDADWAQVRIVPAPPNDKIYGNPLFGGLQYTAGSASVTGYFNNLRQFGAQVRWVLMDNAARHLGVPLAELTTEPSVVAHQKSGRRLTYGEIAAFATIPETAPQVVVEPVSKAQFRLIGKDVRRVDVPGKVNGTAQYSIDVQVPGMIYGAILREPMEGAAPDKIDDTAARAVEGVMKIVPLKYGVGVLADTPWAAFKAKNALKVTWSRSARGWGFSNEKGYEMFAAAAKDLQRKGVAWEVKGDPLAAMKKAVTVFEGEYRADYAYHAQMEPLNSVAAVAPAGNAVEIWCGSQSQTIAVTAVAKALGIPENHVKFNGMLLGGGFGRRGNRDVEFIVDSALMSKAAGRPVKVMWTREDDVHSGRFRPLYVNRIRAGLDESGKIIAWHHRVVCDRVLAFMDPVRFKTAKGRDNIAMRGTELPTYDIPDRMSEGLQEDTGMRTAPLRAIGVGQNSFATEVFIDELAVKRGMDPVQFRLQLLKNAPRARHVVEEVARMATGAGSVPGAASVWPTSTTRARSWRGLPKSRSTGRPARSRCIISGALLMPVSRCSRTMWSRRPKARSFTGSALPSWSASRSTTAPCNSRISTTIKFRACATCPRFTSSLSRHRIIRRAPARLPRHWCRPQSPMRCSS